MPSGRTPIGYWRLWRDTDEFEFPGDGLYPVIDEYIKEIRGAVKDGG